MKVKDVSLDKKILAYAIQHKKYTVELNNAVTVDYFDESIKWLFEIICRHFNNPQFKEVPTETIIEDYLVKSKYSFEEISYLKNIYKEVSSLIVDQTEFSWFV